MDSTGQSTQKTTPSPKEMMDTILSGEFKKDNEFEKLPGYLSHSLRDSLFDTTAFFIADIHVKSADELPSFVNAMQADKSSPPDLLINLHLTHPDGQTKFDFAAIKGKKNANDSSNNIIDLSKLVIGGFHVGVLSENLQHPKVKTSLKSIPGGYEWYIPFKSLGHWGKVKTKKVQFLVRN